MMAQFSARTILLPIALTVACVAFALADEAIPIGIILQGAESYYLHDVTLAGTVRHVKVLPLPFKPPQSCNPMEGGKWSFYKPITFTLEDETGSIVVDRLAACWPPGTKVPEVSDGEKVIIEAQILAPDPGPKGRAIIHAIVNKYPSPLRTTAHPPRLFQPPLQCPCSVLNWILHSIFLDTHLPFTEMRASHKPVVIVTSWAALQMGSIVAFVMETPLLRGRRTFDTLCASLTPYVRKGG